MRPTILSASAEYLDAGSSPRFRGERMLDFLTTQSENQSLEDFDYVIVGAGSAGCVMASRLSRTQVLAFCSLRREAKTEILISPYPWASGRRSPILD